MEISTWVFWILLALWFIIGGYYNYEIDDITDYFDSSKTIISGKHNPNFLNFGSLPISYSFDEDNLCYGKKLDQVRESFSILIEETDGIMNFTELDLDGDITISCMPYITDYAGIGGPEFYEGEQKILSGFIELYELGEDYFDCESYPTTSLHEILHALGFDHINDKRSIMYDGDDDEYVYDELEYCQKIDQEIVDCLKNIYSNGVNGSSCKGLPYLY